MSAPDRTRFEAGTPPKVIGLGAPISVWIYFEVSEIPALLDAIDEQLDRYSTPHQPNGRGGIPAAGADPADWSAHLGELRRMRADVETAASIRSSGRFHAVWSTVMAHDVVHGAVRHAQRRAAVAGAVDKGLDALAAAERTRRAFDAVDNGGLDAVWL